MSTDNDQRLSSISWGIVLIALAAVAAVIAWLLGQAPVSRARIYHDSVLVDTVDLASVTEPYTITVESSAGSDSGINVIAVESMRIRMLMADCPDESCVRQGWSSGGVRPIVCLPHRLVITFEGGEDSDVDAVVG